MPRSPSRERPGGSLPRDAGTHRRVTGGSCVAASGIVRRRAAARVATPSAGGRGLRQAAVRRRRSASTARSSGGDAPSRGCWPRSARPRCARGELGEAADAYLQLAGEDPTRGRGGGRGARGGGARRRASRPGGAHSSEAVIGLQTIAPDRVPGRYALRLAQQQGAEPEELVTLLPGAIAAAGDQGRSTLCCALHAPAPRGRPPGADRRCSSIARWCDGRRTARCGRARPRRRGGLRPRSGQAAATSGPSGGRGALVRRGGPHGFDLGRPDAARCAPTARPRLCAG